MPCGGPAKVERFRRISRRQASQLPRWCDIPAAWAPYKAHAVFYLKLDDLGLGIGIDRRRGFPNNIVTLYGASLECHFGRTRSDNRGSDCQP
jgi:hypothetical protein